MFLIVGRAKITIVLRGYLVRFVCFRDFDDTRSESKRIRVRMVEIKTHPSAMYICMVVLQ